MSIILKHQIKKVHCRHMPILKLWEKWDLHQLIQRIK